MLLSAYFNLNWRWTLKCYFWIFSSRKFHLLMKYWQIQRSVNCMIDMDHKDLKKEEEWVQVIDFDMITKVYNVGSSDFWIKSDRSANLALGRSRSKNNVFLFWEISLNLKCCFLGSVKNWSKVIKITIPQW